jgi:hypothetical protein
VDGVHGRFHGVGTPVAVNGVIGDILPLALAVAISPLPIIAAILMLLSQRSRANSLGFLLGWALGIVVGIVIFELLSTLLEPPSSGSSPLVGIIKIVVGALLLLVGVRQWLKRPRAGTTPAMPKWMAAIDSMKAPAAAGLAFVLVLANPKNLMMTISAGIDIGTGDLSVGQIIVCVVIFLVIAAITIAVPVIGTLIARDAVRPTLERMRVWLVANNAIVMTVLLLVIGVANIGKGIASL